MKIISGKYKARVIKGFNMLGTRPTMDRVKESLFASVQEYIKDSLVLDLYSGSGNLAIEAISNGAKYAYLVDNSKIAIKTIKENIKSLNIDNAKIIHNDAIITLKEFIKSNIGFDIIFLDPPYNTNEIEKALQIFNDNLILLNKDAIVICETTKDINYNQYNNLYLYKSKKYGDKKVFILKLKPCIKIK